MQLQHYDSKYCKEYTSLQNEAEGAAEGRRSALQARRGLRLFDHQAGSGAHGRTRHLTRGSTLRKKFFGRWKCIISSVICTSFKSKMYLLKNNFFKYSFISKSFKLFKPL